MSNVIRSLVVKVGADLTEFQKNMKTISKDLKKTGKELSAAGATLTKGLTVPILGAATALTGLAVSAGKQADELITLSNKTGIATQALQEMEYAARFIDVEVETMTGSMQKLTKNMDMARRGSKEQEEAFKRLGVEFKNQDGSLRNAKEVWAESIDALGKVASEADRDALAMNIFGKSAVELNPLIKAGSDELNRLGKEAHDVGAVMSDENVTALGKFDDQMQKLQAVLKTAGAEIGAAFIPVLEKLMPIIQDKIVPAIQSFAGFVSGLVDKFSNASPQMQGFIVALLGIAVAIGPIISVIGSIVTVVSGVVAGFGAASAVIAGGGGIIAALGALLGPVGIVLVVIAALAAAAYLIIKNWEPIKAFFINLWTNVKDWIVTAWDNIKNFFTETIPQIIDTIIDFFTHLPEKLGYAMGFVLGTLIQWGIDAVKWAIENVPKIITNVITFFNELPLKLATAIAGGITAFATWATELIAKAKVEIPKVILNIINFFAELPGKILDIGRNVVTGLWSGIQEKISWLKNKITGFASGIVSGIKDAMGIHSPSKVMADQVGKWIPAGISKGILASRSLVDDAMSALSTDMSMSVNPMMGGMQLAGTGAGGTANIYVELDGRTIASVIGQPLVDLIRVKTGVRI